MCLLRLPPSVLKYMFFPPCTCKQLKGYKYISTRYDNSKHCFGRIMELRIFDFAFDSVHRQVIRLIAKQIPQQYFILESRFRDYITLAKISGVAPGNFIYFKFYLILFAYSAASRPVFSARFINFQFYFDLFCLVMASSVPLRSQTVVLAAIKSIRKSRFLKIVKYIIK